MEWGFLETRVARRVLFLFVVCALFPVTAMAVLSYRSVQKQLLEESRTRLGNTTKNAATAVVERFQFLEDVAGVTLVPLAFGSRAEGEGGEGPAIQEGRVDAPRLQALEGFEAALVIGPDGEPRALFGEMPLPPDPKTEEIARLRVGSRATFRIDSGADGSTEILLFMDLSDEVGGRSALWARVDQGFLWATAIGYATLSTTAGLCIQDEVGRPLHCTLSNEAGLLRALEDLWSRSGGSDRGVSHRYFEWEDDQGQRYLAATREIVLKPQFGIPNLMASVSEARTESLASMRVFRSSFLGVVVLALVVVGLLSNVQIRRSLMPLEELRRGTARISQGDLQTEVAVSSGDEFEVLADSFNAMTSRLQTQFQALETIGEIDRAILSALDTETIVETVLERTREILPCHAVGICRLDWRGAREGRLRISVTGDAEAVPEEKIILSFEELRFLSQLRRPERPGDPALLSKLAGRAVPPAEKPSANGLLAPLRIKGNLAGYVVVAGRGEFSFKSEDEAHLGQIAEQLSVALANADLLEDLDRMNWGALTALARAVDAKSSWTLGHSERVTSYSVALARGMGLDETSVLTLQRGGLIHDLGKIAVPGTILDKPGPLTPEEYVVVRQHPEAGVRILEPIPGMERIIPIVLHHHEAWNGSGYPMGLAGEAIPYDARLLAVVDRFDAITSERPYRAAIPLDQAVNWMRAAAGHGLDPDIVQVFLTELREGRIPIRAEIQKRASA